MPQRQPEGKIKDACKEIADAEGLIFWQVEGKSRNGFPDTLAGKATAGGILIEFKVPGKEPSPQQWVRIYELREAGIEAWWTDSVEGYRKLVRLDPGGYEVVWPERLHEWL